MLMKCYLFVVVFFVLDTPLQFANGYLCLTEGTYQDSEEVTNNYKKQYPMSAFPNVQCVHLSINGTGNMDVMWFTPVKWSANTRFDSVCNYGTSATALTSNVSGNPYSYTAGGFQWTLNIATLNLTSMQSPTGLYFYQCGDAQFGMSEILNFTLQPEGVPTKTGGKKVAFVGDWGVTNGEFTIASITNRVESGEVQLIVHAGDISYANKYGLETHNNSHIWVAYMNALQPMASRVPYMVAVGNHESQFNFAAYLNWLKTPSALSGSTSPFWYSFDYMGVHYVSFSTEHDFSPNSTQHRWIEQDLKDANENRKKVPWIVIFGHRPLYCTSWVCTYRCGTEAPRYRSYLEDLLWQYKVDLFMSGHNHQYERSYPVYKTNKTQDNYVNPKAPVYIVNGAAGCPELNDPTFRPGVDWRAFDEPSFETGYLLMEVSDNELKFEYILSKGEITRDKFTISRTSD